MRQNQRFHFALFHSCLKFNISLCSFLVEVAEIIFLPHLIFGIFGMFPQAKFMPTNGLTTSVFCPSNMCLGLGAGKSCYWGKMSSISHSTYIRSANIVKHHHHYRLDRSYPSLVVIMIYSHSENSLGLRMIAYLQILITVAVIIQALSNDVPISEGIVGKMVM